MLSGYSQSAPAVDENIPYLMTFGGNASTGWGDDDFCQIFFCVIPNTQTQPVYIRVFDPDTGGSLDEAKGDFNTVINYSVLGEKDVGPIRHLKVSIPPETLKAAIYYLQNHLELIPNMISNGSPSAPLILQKENTLKNCVVMFLRSLQKEYRVMTATYINIF
jgi:hypothetical protein